MKLEKKHRLLLALAIIIIAIFIYTHADTIFSSNTDKPQRITVTVQPVLQKTATAYLSAIGTAQAYATVNIKSQVDGQLLKVGFNRGQVVQSGQLLFAIDPRPYQIALQQAQANLAKDQAQLTNSTINLQRFTKLLKSGYVAQQDYDTTKANTATLAATVKADQASVANAQLQLSYANITAPISGRTGDILVEAGNLVQSNANTTLVAIAQMNPIYIAFTVPQRYLPVIQQEQARAPLTVLAYINKHFKAEQGQLSFINNTIDATTGTVQLKATFANADQLLWPGQFVQIQLPSATLKNALIIPTQALQSGQKGNYVFVVRNGIAHYRAVTVGPIVKEGTIIESGLMPGEQIAIDGQFLLTNGTPVKIVTQ